MSSELTGQLETERKFDVDLDFSLPDLRDIGGAGPAEMQPPEAELLVARYYDTDDLRLAAAGVTLRRRTGGHDAGWHLKLPVGGDTRREVHAPLGDGTEAVPPELAALVATWAGGRPLRPVATLETRRTLWRIAGRDGGMLAELADDLVSGQRMAPSAPAGNRALSASVTWREIEVELVSGPPAILAAAGQRLRQAGATPSGSANKLSRVLAAPAAGG
jgi:inorganic triphosphatase YgiF